MIEKQLFHTILSRLSNGSVRISYWDGDTQTYGKGQPYCHIHIKNAKVLRAILKNMSLGFGEAYSKGLIEVEGRLSGLIQLLAENEQAFAGLTKMLRLAKLHKNIRSKQKGYIAHHYDIGNDFYKLWLDKNMLYSCAYFKKPTDTLEIAQQQKIEHILRKLQLHKGQRLLDIGSGWGTLLLTAAKKYGIIGHGVTLSEQQLKHSKKAAQKAGLSKQVTFELANYQQLPERPLQFDRVVSVGMFEHVGKGNHKHYFEAVDRLLKPGGLSVLHTISQQLEQPVDPWIDTYIFPGGYIPSNREIVYALPTYNFRLTDYENLRIHYAMTCEEWMHRYESHKETIIKQFDEQFYRMWHLWLASSAASFRYGQLDLSQYVFTKGPQNDLPLTRDFIYNN